MNDKQARPEAQDYEKAIARIREHADAYYKAAHNHGVTCRQIECAIYGNVSDDLTRLAAELAAARAADRAEQAPAQPSSAKAMAMEYDPISQRYVFVEFVPAREPSVAVSELRELVTEMVNRSGVEMTDWIDAIYAICDRAAEEKGT